MRCVSEGKGVWRVCSVCVCSGGGVRGRGGIRWRLPCDETPMGKGGNVKVREVFF